MGRHSKPTKSKTRNALVVGGTTLALSAATVTPALAIDWDPIIACESGGRNVKNANSTASGYYQIINGTWRTYGGTQFAPTARQASKAEQTTVANRIYADSGLTPWNASKGCWGALTNQIRNGNSAVTGDDVPKKRIPKHRAKVNVSGTYTVQDGDYMVKIAAEQGIKGGWRALWAANPHIKNPHKIVTGQKLNLP